MLGIILSPFGQLPGAYPSEIAYSIGGDGQYLQPFDPRFNTQGEPGLYYDTQLGGVPTDAELSYNYQYTPVMTGEVAANGGHYTAPWVPPNGWRAGGAFAGPQLRDVTPSTTINPSSDAQAIANVIANQNDRLFKLTILSTTVVAISAIIATYRQFKAIKREEMLLKHYGRRTAQ